MRLYCKGGLTVSVWTYKGPASEVDRGEAVVYYRGGSSHRTVDRLPILKD